jgi:Uroporphyrinogen decarboxylase (URO-D)
MNHRERMQAILHYEDYDRLPIVHFGFWKETLAKWADEGHISRELAEGWTDGKPEDRIIGDMLGFDSNWSMAMGTKNFLMPYFEREVVAELPDGTRHVRDSLGAIIVEKDDATCIPAEIDHTLKDRASWEEHYKWRFDWADERITTCNVLVNDAMIPWTEGGLDFLQKGERDYPYGIACGSMFGRIRSMMGIEGICYLEMDDPELFSEIIDTVGNLCYDVAKYSLESGAKYDFAFFWEDICFKTGPLVRPTTFREKCGPHYKRITDLLKEYGIDIVSVDCDGKIDALVPIWLENGVNTMFPIEVGTWEASIAPWREQYGRELRGVGGMNKTVFGHDKAAIDAEVERLKPLVDLGGYIPCPDHRIAPEAKWELVRYYCDRMRETFGG